jgi:hypothetical protein
MHAQIKGKKRKKKKRAQTDANSEMDTAQT